MNSMNEVLEKEYAKYWQNTLQYVLVRNESPNQEDSYSIIDVNYHLYALIDDDIIKEFIIKKMLQNNSKIYQSIEEAFEDNKELYTQMSKKTIHDWYK